MTLKVIEGHVKNTPFLRFNFCFKNNLIKTFYQFQHCEDIFLIK